MSLQEFGHVLRLADVDVLVVHPFPEGEEGCFIAFAGIVVLDVDHASLGLDLSAIPLGPMLKQ